MKNKGITLIEILIAIAIFSLLSIFFLFSYTSNRRGTELGNNTNQIVSILYNAKQRTLTSENSSSWGVHFEEHGYTLFQGDDFATATNKTEYNLSSEITLAYNFSAGADIVFTRITGYPNQAGSITLYLASPSGQSTICINPIGTIEINGDCSPAAPIVQNAAPASSIPTSSLTLTLTLTLSPATLSPSPPHRFYIIHRRLNFNLYKHKYELPRPKDRENPLA